jgi:hypothetical protein
MTRRLLPLCAASAVLSLLSARSAMVMGQQLGPIVGIVRSPVPALSPANGVLLGETAILHLGVGVDGGYDSNVFYNDEQKVGSYVLRVAPFLSLTNTARNGEIPSGLFFDSRVSLTYKEYFSSAEDITRLRAFTPSAMVSVEHNSRGTVAVGASDSYARLQDPPYVRGVGQSLITRNNNVATAFLRWSPGGGRLQGVLRYTNTLDLFETDYFKPANSMGHEGMLDVSWRWLPKTALYLQLRQGYIGYLNSQSAPGLTADSRKSNSAPLRAMVGIRGLITEKTSVSIALGYQNAFYANGETTSGFLGSTTAAAELVILPITYTRISIGGKHDFQNSVIGNFYYSDGAYASLSQQAGGRVVGQLWASYEYRRYYGLPGFVPGTAATEPRRDNVLQAGGVVDFYVQNWAYVGASYTLTRNQSDYQVALPGLNYNKHEIFARLGITY